MTKKIATVCIDIPGFDESEDFNSKLSLLSYDIVLFRPYFTTTTTSTKDGHPELSSEKSKKFIDDLDHWKREIISFLNAGKNIFIFLCEKKEYSVQTEEFDIFNSVNNNYKFLEFMNINITPAKIKKSKIINNIFKKLLKEFTEYFQFRNYIEIKSSKSLITTITTYIGNKKLGVHFKRGKGNIFFLPDIYFYKNENIKEIDQGTLIWNERAIKHGKSFIREVINIDKCLSTESEKTPAPDWIKGKIFETKIEKKIKSEINILSKEIEKFKEELSNKENSLINEIQLKDLLFETGKPLENVVIKALHLLGYKAENYNDGILEIDQVILSPEGYRFIGECEGKDTKPIDISKFRQLADLINEDFEREHINEKAYGLLFGNAMRLIPINKRNDFFTEKCIKGAIREKFGLIKTTDLFFICKNIIDNNGNCEDYKKKCRYAIYNGLGEIIKFPKFSRNS